MTDLEKLKKCFDEIGYHYMETKEDNYTYIALRSPGDLEKPVDTKTEKYFEFDENGDWASYS